ncbi:MAG TPA: cyclic nucleotide-binding domain-containing protein [Ktedonobacteraceae bacterium]|jgi:CRP-like cAMP-binding protein
MTFRKMFPSFRSFNRESSTKQDYLLTMDIFRDLQPEAVHTIEHQTFMRSYPKGQILYSQNDRAEALFLLKRGQVHLYRLTPGGKWLELAMLELGTFFQSEKPDEVLQGDPSARWQTDPILCL